MNIALLGFGVVGRGVYDLTLNRSDINVKYVLCLEDVQLPGVIATRDYQQILSDESVDTVVEAMGGLHPAWDFVKAAIEHGKNVVTSNKAMACTFYDELLPLSRKRRSSSAAPPLWAAASAGSASWAGFIAAKPLSRLAAL